MATGWLEKEHQLLGFPFPDTGPRFRMLEEALAYLQPPSPIRHSRAGMERLWIQSFGDDPDDLMKALDRLTG